MSTNATGSAAGESVMSDERARRHRRQTARHDRPRRPAWAEERARDHREVERRAPEPGLERGPVRARPAGRGREEHRRRRGRADRRRHAVRDGEARPAQRPRRQDRGLGAPLDARERGEREHAAAERDGRARGVDAGQAVHEQRDARRDGYGAGEVEPLARTVRPALHQEARREHDSSCAQRQVDEEHRRPPERLHEHSADQPAGRAAGRLPRPSTTRPRAGAPQARRTSRRAARTRRAPRSPPRSPATARAATSAIPDGASAQASDAPPNTISPTRNSRRRPNRSAARPAATSRPPNVSA